LTCIYKLKISKIPPASNFTNLSKCSHCTWTTWRGPWQHIKFCSLANITANLMSYSQVGWVSVSCLWSLVSTYTMPDMPACWVRSMRSYGLQTKTRSWFFLSKKILNEKMQACQEWSHQWVSSHYHTANQQIAVDDLIRLEADPTSSISMNK
jgi:hypothetical protein